MIQKKFNYYKKTPSDINEHLEILKRVSQDCSHITEMGVRGMVSSWAFLEGLRGTKGKLVSIDIKSPVDFGTDLPLIEKQIAKEKVDFKFILGDSLKIEIEPTDFLFIDTIHIGKQLSKELSRHASKVRKYIGFHDTESCGKELVPVIDNFLKENRNWDLFYFTRFNNGLTIIKRYV